MEKDILAEAKDAFAECEEAESDNRAFALDDLRFGRLGEQWEEAVKNQRSRDGRPCLTINKMPAFIRQVTNDARQNKPSIKVHPVDDTADVETAKVMDGIIRNIEYISNADVAYDTAIDFAASMGFGYWRVDVDYSCDDTFDLDLLINRISNPFAVYGDPNSAAADSSDWNLAFVTDMVKKGVFSRMYPDAEQADWETSGNDEGDHSWFDGDEIRIAEYWRREKVQRNLLLLSDRRAVYEDDFVKPNNDTGLSMADLAYAQGIQVARQRQTMSYKVKQYIITGTEVLEENDWMGRYIPIVPVYGEEINIEGKRHFLSLIRQAKDAQRMFNYWRTASTELVALAPRAPFIGPKGSFRTDVNKWASANNTSHPYIEFDPVPGQSPPQRQPFTGVPAGALQEAMNASDDMKAIMGIYDASLGARSNETSGKAILARQQEGDTSTFHFIDNLARAIRHTGRVLIDLIPHVYSEARIMRVLGEDGATSNVPVNQPLMQDGQPMMKPDGKQAIYSLTTGKYDLTVTTGPSYNTKRQEAASQMIEAARAFPGMLEFAGDLLAKNLDWPGADKLAERWEQVTKAKMAPPPDPMQSPEIILKTKSMEMDKEKSDQEMRIKREQMNLQREEAEFNAALKMREFDAEMVRETKRMQMETNKAMHAAQNEMLGKIGGGDMDENGNPIVHPLVALLEQMAATNQATQQSLVQTNQLIQQMVIMSNAPKTISMTTSQGKQLQATVLPQQQTVN